ncbi:MAG: phage portal protein [Firmicutes bacterium]|nr:phage portal protein [Bacillota bacterium]
MDIVFSANNNEEIKILPIVPAESPEISTEQKNETFDTVNNGTLQLIGDMGLKSLSISSIFPCNDYKWIKSGSSTDGWSYVNFFEKWRKAKVPIRCVIIGKDGKVVLNIACLINNFTYREKRIGDIAYTLDIVEYRFVK